MEIMTIPILCGELPKFIGAICYEGDKNVKRLEFTGAEPGLQYKLDMERTDGTKNVVDLVNQNGTLILNMDGSTHIPAGRYQVQLRTIGDTVKHTNKAFLTVRDSINAVNAFASGIPTEMEQMEARITDAMHRSEASAAGAETAAIETKSAAERAKDAAIRAEEAAESVKAEVFIAEYYRTTWEDLKAAYDAGKHIEVNRNGNQYGLYAADSTRMEFRQPGTANTPYCRCTNAGKWSYGYYPITPEDINAMPGYQGLITGGDLDDYTSPGTYKIEKEHNNEVAHAPFVGEVGTFLQVIPFRENPYGNETDFRVLQEAITNKHGGALDRKWRVKSREVNGVMWSEWQDSSEVYIATYDTSINPSQDKVQEMWNSLTWMFGKSDDGQLLGHKTVFCRYPIWDAEKSQYEYHMIPLSKITPNYASFRGMTSDSTMRIVYFYNTSVSDSTKWGWSTKTQSMVTTTTLNSKISALEDTFTEVPVSVDLTAFESNGVIVETYADNSQKTYTMEFDENGNPVKITDSNGNVTVLTW